jgi:hypothetical protein
MRQAGKYAFNGMGATPNQLVEAIVKIFSEEEDRAEAYKARRNPLILNVDGKEGQCVITDYEIKDHQLVLLVEGQF